MSADVQAGSVVDAARDVAATLPERAQEIEAARSLPPDIVAALRANGLFGLMAPKALGGREVEPRTVVSVIEEISKADPSTGWTVLVGQGAGYLAWLEPEAAAELLATHPDPVVVGSMAPIGRVTRVAGTDARIRISGRWPYSSGAMIADLLIGGYPGGSEGFPPRPRFALFDASQVRVHDTWRSAGLRGTGSHDIEVTDVEVPIAHTFDPFGPAAQPGALYRLPYMTFLMTAMAGFPLGVTSRIVADYFAIAPVKRTAERSLLAETPLAQAELGRVAAAAAAARSGVFDALDLVWEQAQQGTPTLRARAMFTGAVQHAMHVAIDTADVALRACGASQLYDRAPLQRYFRDINAAAAHIAFGPDAQRRVGAALLGLDVPDAYV